MDEIRKVLYQNKEILYLDFSGCGTDKEKTMSVLKGVFPALAVYPPQSALTLTNVEGLHFNMEILNTFKEIQKQIKPYQKKAAVIGVRGLQKIAVDTVTALTSDKFTKTFDTEAEAQEWLIS